MAQNIADAVKSAFLDHLAYQLHILRRSPKKERGAMQAVIDDVKGGDISQYQNYMLNWIDNMIRGSQDNDGNTLQGCADNIRRYQSWKIEVENYTGR